MNSTIATIRRGAVAERGRVTTTGRAAAPADDSDDGDTGVG
jgi:hypothetical protein